MRWVLIAYRHSLCIIVIRWFSCSSFVISLELEFAWKKFGLHVVFSINLSNVNNKPGKKNTTNRNASNAPRPSKSPIDETIGSVDVHDKIKPTLDKIDADTPIEKIFSSMVFFTAASALISLRRYV